jgi:tRNA A-37 threonylcarbamoyl transferase component Bud32
VKALQSWISTWAGGLCWQVDPSWQQFLPGPDGLPLEDWLRAGQATIVKHASHRTVYKVELPGLSCYIKHNRLIDVRTWLRELVRPSKARTECRKALRIAGRAIPTVRPIAVGEGMRGLFPGESFLVTLALPEAEPLESFLIRTCAAPGRPCSAGLRQKLARILARFLARMHDAGVRHHDLHPGNILVRSSPAAHEMFLVDLHAVALGAPPNLETSRDNLVLINHWFALRSSRTDRLRFWKEYWQARTTPAAKPGWPLLRVLAADMEHRTWKSMLSLWRRRDQRCLGSNRHFRRVASPHVTGHAVRELEHHALAPFLADPDALFLRPDVRMLKDSRSSTVGEFSIRVGGATRQVIFKRFRVTAWHDGFTGLVRWTPALRSWINGQRLLERNLPTPVPLLVLHRRKHGLRREGYLLMDKIDGATDLHGFVERLAEATPRRRRQSLHACLNEVAGLIRRLHACRMSHRDLKAANILVADPLPGTAAMRSWLIDLVGVTQERRLKRSVRARNLARLNASFHGNSSVSRTDRLRFLLAYLHVGLRGREVWREWWKDIAAATEAKIVRNMRRRRVLH